MICRRTTLGYGFNNIADLLSVSPNQLELYLKTAEQAIAQLDATAKPSPNWAKNDQTYWEPDDGVFLPIKNVELRFNNNQVRVRKVLETFLPRAYRRPVKKKEIDRLMVFAQLSLTQEGESFIRPKSVYAPLRAALCSPYFLYRIEQDPPEGTAPINEYELANRLSYFLWSSMPDDESVQVGGGKSTAGTSGRAGPSHAERPQGAGVNRKLCRAVAASDRAQKRYARSEIVPRFR